MRLRILPLFVFFCTLPLAAQNDKLPIKRIVLYKNGVGYFEHLGPIHGTADVSIDFTSGQLNDVLKSLTVLDLNGGKVSGVAYGSSAPVERQLGDLRLGLGEKASLSDFLGALRGAKIAVRSGTTVIAGRLLSVERKTRVSGGTTLEVDYISLLSDTGELRTTELSPQFSVRLLDRGLPGKLDRYLDLAGAQREADVRRMVISTTGQGDRNLFVSYISEVPVWKSTYRIVLREKSQPLLQGWAIVDNTVGQDWDRVELSLVAGAPQSFIQNLSQPYYARRPVIGLPEAVNSAPQTFESTLIAGGASLRGLVADASGAGIGGASIKAISTAGQVLGQTQSDAMGNYEIPVPDGITRLEVSSPGFSTTVVNGIIPSPGAPMVQNVTLNVGSVSESVAVNANAAMINTETSSTRSTTTGSGARLGLGRGAGSGGGVGAGLTLNEQMGLSSKTDRFNRLDSGNVVGGAYKMPAALDAARALSEAAARAQALGDLFEYKLKEPVTIQKNRSALVPIVQSEIGAEKVSVWNEGSGRVRPERALWLTNSSGLTLDGGSFSVLEQDTFAGEGIFDPIHPGEKRLVSYATDLSVTPSGKTTREQERVTRVRIAHGTMVQTNELLERKTYTFRNEDSSPRTIVVEHPVREGYQLRGDLKPSETTPAWLRFRVQVEPKQSASLVVEEAKPVDATFGLSNLNAQTVELFVRQKSINPSVAEMLRKVLAQKDVVDSLEAQKDAHEEEAKKIYDDQQRIRENMKALKGTAEEKALIQRYTQQLNAQEDRLEKLEKEGEELEKKHDEAQAALDKMIERLSYDGKL